MANNMDIFNATATYILGKLYENFPSKALIDRVKIIEYIEKIMEIKADDKIVSESILFLQMNGYINHMGSELEKRNDNIHYSINAYVLADKGLTALQRVPDSLGPTLGEQLRANIYGTGKEVGRQALNSTIGEVIGGFVKSLVN